MHQRIPVTSRFAAEGFGGSKFTPMRSIGAPPAPGVPIAAAPGPSPSPSPAPAPEPSPNVFVRPPAFIVPPQYPPQEPVFVTEAPSTDDTTKTLITVAAAIGIFALGAALF